MCSLPSFLPRSIPPFLRLVHLDLIRSLFCFVCRLERSTNPTLERLATNWARSTILLASRRCQRMLYRSKSFPSLFVGVRPLVTPSSHRCRFHQHFDSVVNVLLIGKKVWKVCHPYRDVCPSLPPSFPSLSFLTLRSNQCMLAPSLPP